jgi:hypothetical protein
MIKRLPGWAFLSNDMYKTPFSREWFPKILDCWDDG